MAGVQGWEGESRSHAIGLKLLRNEWQELQVLIACIIEELDCLKLTWFRRDETIPASQQTESRFVQVTSAIRYEWRLRLRIRMGRVQLGGT